MFVDASAIVAILTREPNADALADVLEQASAPITSPIAIFEAALGPLPKAAGDHHHRAAPGTSGRNHGCGPPRRAYFPRLSKSGRPLTASDDADVYNRAEADP
jgi:hypothetical protein